MKDLGRRTLRGLKWSYTGSVATAVLQMGFGALLARLLNPRAFGLVAMSYVVVGLAQHMSSMGLNSALVQKHSLCAEEIRASFSAATVAGTVAAALLWSVSPWVASLMREPEVERVLLALAPVFIINGLGVTASGILRREMRFKETAAIETVAYLFGYGVVGLPLALSGKGVWSLVMAALARAVFWSMALYFASRHPVRPILRLEPYKYLLLFGGKVSILGLLESLGTKIDTFAVGRWLGAGALGYYDRAFKVAYLPVEHVMKALGGVLVPSFSRVRDDIERSRSAYSDGIALLSFVAFPAGWTVAVVAPEIVGVLLGTGWGESVEPLRIVALGIPLAVLTRTGESVAEAAGMIGRKTWLRAVHVILLALLLGTLLPRAGVPGAAGAFVIAEGVLAIGYFVWMSSLLGVGVLALATGIAPGVLTGVAVAGVTLAIAVGVRFLELGDLVVLLAAGLGAGLALGLTMLRGFGGRVWWLARRRGLLHSGDVSITRRLVAACDRIAVQGST